MNYEHYDNLKISADYLVYDFVSKGIKGEIEKRIAFQPLQGSLVFNVAFGNKVGDAIDDYSVSDNKDMTKIISTVATAIELFLTVYPDRYVYCCGSTMGRTRLYRMAIGNNLQY
ncbi:MAG: hypothetical protein J7497_16315, partial [Chitinophagaceae bacterium]|nr:hypothetical protein [Chitinophagaceae bacterium]